MPPRPGRRAALLSFLPLPALAQDIDTDPVLRAAAATADLRSLIVARQGEVLFSRAFRGPGLDAPVNIKSASKTVVAMLAGIAIARGVLDGLDQPVAPLLAGRIPPEADPRLREVTVGHLLAMRAGLESTSGRNYGAWVASRDWLRFALSRPMVDEPGGAMIYSTGSTHVLGAALARASRRSLRDLAQDWLFGPLGHAVPDWTRDPQGLHFGGNEMALSPRALLAFGECCRNGGVHHGRQLIPAAFLRTAWVPQGRSSFSGQAYGMGWWIAEARGQPVVFAWGYGGQMVYLLPGPGLTVVMTSNPDVPRVPGQVFTRHALLVEGILPALGAS
ncbi:serine hydrolase domain-containing protein [Falsiroseomonas sp. CW058]|uniref:serine hydrolase domain-containing protein n=1 Tax=Falsiroseomonas sp. CW058 TaxID=3388664 RepID=UPI003D317377